MSNTQSASNQDGPTNAELLQVNPEDILPPASNESESQHRLPKTLTLLYRVGTDPLDYHRAVVPFPETYQDAIQAAIRLLGGYMQGCEPDAIILRCLTKSFADDFKTQRWVWADIEPEHWKTILADRPGEVGVFHKDTFLHGKLCLTSGSWNGRETTWTSPGKFNLIDRPRSFSEAVSRVKSLRSGQFFMSQVSEDMSFYTIEDTSLSFWTAFPPAAYVDEEVWRATVPLPDGILGVKFGVD